MLLSDDQVATELKSLTSKNCIGWTRHAEERMALRGFDKGQVKECLKKGTFTERPTLSNKPGDIQYSFRVEAVIDGERMAVGAALIPSRKVVVITVIPIK